MRIEHAPSSLSFKSWTTTRRDDSRGGISSASCALNALIQGPPHCSRYVDLLVKLAGEEAVALGLQEHVCRLSLHMDSLARLKVSVTPAR
jgi:hypothetical protein